MVHFDAHDDFFVEFGPSRSTLLDRDSFLRAQAHLERKDVTAAWGVLSGVTRDSAPVPGERARLDIASWVVPLVLLGRLRKVRPDAHVRGV